MKSDFVYLGRVVNTHGIKGEIRILSNFEKKEIVFKKGFKVYFGSQKKEEIINSYRVHKKLDMVTLVGIKDINEVLKYKGTKVYVKREDLNLKENDFVLDDILGLKVFQGCECFGIVKDVFLNKDQILLLVSFLDKEYYVPYVADFVKQVNINEGKIIVERIEEFL